MILLVSLQNSTASALEEAQRRAMIETAQASAEDIKAGRVLSPVGVAKQTKAYWAQ